MKKALQVFLIVCIIALSTVESMADSMVTAEFSNVNISLKLLDTIWTETEQEVVENGIERHWTSDTGDICVGEYDYYDLMDNGEGIERSQYNYSNIIDACTDASLSDFIKGIFSEDVYAITDYSKTKKGSVNYLSCSGTYALEGETYSFTAYITINDGYVVFVEFLNVADAAIEQVICTSKYTKFSIEHVNGLTTALSILIGIILTALAYMLYPFIRTQIMKVKYDENTCNKMAAINSAVVGVVFLVTTLMLTDYGEWSVGPALLYYFINKRLWVSKDEVIESEDNSASQQITNKEDCYNIKHGAGINSSQLVNPESLAKAQETINEAIPEFKAKDESEENKDILMITDNLNKVQSKITSGAHPKEIIKPGPHISPEKRADAQLAINKAMREGTSMHNPQNKVSNSDNSVVSDLNKSLPVESLKLLKELYDEGVITEKEFVEKKKQLLGL